MKLIAELFVSPVYVEEQVVESLCEQFPVCKKGAGFGLKAPIDDPLFRNVEAAIVKVGLVKRSYSETPIQNQYFYGVHREYDDGDFCYATYLRLVHTSKLCDDRKRDAEGRLIVEAWRLTPELRMGCVLFEAAVVSDKLRQTIEKEGFIGVAFRPLNLIPASEVMDIRTPKATSAESRRRIRNTLKKGTILGADEFLDSSTHRADSLTQSRREAVCR